MVEIFLSHLDKPHNPLLNSGAIMSSSILLNKVHPEMKMSEKFDYVTDYLRKMAGGEFVGYVTYHNIQILGDRVIFSYCIIHLLRILKIV